MKKIGVLISGGGTNLQALIDKQGTVLKSGKIVCVCSNNSKAYGLERAKNAGIANKILPPSVISFTRCAVAPVTLTP